MKNSNDNIGNQTRDLSDGITAPSCASGISSRIVKFILSGHPDARPLHPLVKNLGTDYVGG